MTDYFTYQQQQLHVEELALSEIARQFGTPCYVYSRASIEENWRAFDSALGNTPHLVCFAVKANSNLAVLNVLARLGSGFDIVSGGELSRVLQAGGAPDKIVFSGVGKTLAEIRQALDVGIHCFNVESQAELLRINQVAADMDKCAPVSLRVNPDVDAKTHPYISTGLRENKFGIDIKQAIAVYQEAANLKNLKVVGIDCHIGSQLTETRPFIDALSRIMALVEELAKLGILLQHIDVGGGLGVCYKEENPPSPQEYVAALQTVLGANHPYKILLEPGRAIVGNAGVLLTQVEYLKENTANKHFAIVDAGMNDLIRPALYQAWQAIVPITQQADRVTAEYDVVGPVCETGDFLGKSRSLAIAAGDILAVRSSGAYGFVMSSNYNTRPRATEIMVDGDKVHVIRRRETLEDLLSLESVLP